MYHVAKRLKVIVSEMRGQHNTRLYNAVLYCAVQVTFRALLDEFFQRHDPTALNRQGNDVGTQYRGEWGQGAFL
jgi:peptide methionine sulfoxide reductase MsrA